MAIYAIGDVQGCYDELARLLGQINVDPARDEIWFVGDLVNRGPKSAEVLRLVRSLGKAATVTLGNHDLHLLALAYGRRPEPEDAPLADILEHEDGDAIINWLRRRPLITYHPELNTLMVHAGLIPQWDPLQAVKLGREVEQVLRGDGCAGFLQSMYGERPTRWSNELEGNERLRFIVNCLTRIRYCHADGQMDFSNKLAPGEQADGLIPWFEMPNRASSTVRVVFGHWASLGLLQRENLIGLDTGCVWGRSLTAIRLDGPGRVFSVPART